MIIQDKLNRPILKIEKNGYLAVARYPDMDEETKQLLINIYNELTTNENNIEDFLNYNENKDEFCS